MGGVSKQEDTNKMSTLQSKQMIHSSQLITYPSSATRGAYPPGGVPVWSPLFSFVWHLDVTRSQQQNALGYNLSMQGIGTVAIDGRRFQEFSRSRKDFFEVSQGGFSQGGLARILLLGCPAGLILNHFSSSTRAPDMQFHEVWSNEEAM